MSSPNEQADLQGRSNLPPVVDPISALDQAISQAPAAVAAVDSLEGLATLESTLLGKTSSVGEVRRGMGKLDPVDRPRVGAKLNEAAEVINTLLTNRRAELEDEDEGRRLQEESIDVTLEAITFPTGSLHLIQQTIDEAVDIFVGLGYRVASGPEAELAWYNFDALNTPLTHPSRLESDTMYLDWGDPDDEVLLRTHTGAVDGAP